MTLSLLTCATVAGLGAALVSGPGPQRVLRQRLHPHRAAPGRGKPVRARVHHGVRAFVLAAAVTGVLVVAGPSALLLAVVAALVVGGAQWLVAAGQRRARAAQARHQTLEVCDALAAEMRAGQAASQALTRAAELYPVLLPAARAGALGGDVPAALRGLAAASRDPRAGTGTDTGARSGMLAIASAWQVAGGAGAGLADALERVAETLREDDATKQEVTASLSPARATARLLAVLPVFGLLVGAALGGDPLELLLGTPLGHALLLAGVVLALAGTVWVERLALSAES